MRAATPTLAIMALLALGQPPDVSRASPAQHTQHAVRVPGCADRVQRQRLEHRRVRRGQAQHICRARQPGQVRIQPEDAPVV